MKKPERIFLIAIVIVLLACAITGIYLFRQSRYQNEEANKQVDLAMVDYSSISDKANQAGESIKNITSKYASASSNGQPMTQQDIDAARTEIENAKKSLTEAEQSATGYQQNIDQTESFTVDDDYETYLVKVKESGDSIIVYIHELEGTLIKLDAILYAYSCGQKIGLYQLDSHASGEDYYNQLILRISAEKDLYSAEAQLCSLGILEPKYQETNAYLSSCNVKLEKYADAVKASQTDSLDQLFTDYQTDCSGEKYSGYVQLRETTWTVSMQNYFSQTFTNLNDLQCVSRYRYEEARAYHEKLM